MPASTIWTCRLKVWLASNGEELVAEQGGRAADYREEAGARIMQAAEITVRVDLAAGRGPPCGPATSPTTT
jgi:N-acetylglutamate synthase/N-acetylornithine aminotransferase